MRNILFVKADTSGMSPDQALDYVKKYKKDLRKCFTKDELKEINLLILPSFEGDVSSVDLIVPPANYNS